MSGLIWDETVCKKLSVADICRHRQEKITAVLHVLEFIMRSPIFVYYQVVYGLLYFREKHPSLICFFTYIHYSKTCHKGPLKNRQNKGLNDKW